MNELEKQGCIDSKLKHLLYPTSEYLPCFYALPKIHRDNVPLRPIVSSDGYITYDIAKLLAFILRPFVGITKHIVLNSFDFAIKIKGMTLKPAETFISNDMVGLFTSIPPVQLMSFTKHYLKILHSLIELFILVIRYVIYCICAFVPMGSPVSPIVSSLYMEQC